jgi:hypothetical protein
MKVFSTLTPEMIDPGRSSAAGVTALRSFLEFAQGRELPVNENILFRSNDDLTAVGDAIAGMLNDAGYETVRNVGRSEYKIDIGVVDKENPDKYMLGILLDGIPYGNSKTARDRDISQISVLQGLGWKLHRVWTMDWWDNPDMEIKKILDILAAPPEPDPDPEQETSEKTDKIEESTEGASPASSVSEYREYKKADLPIYQSAPTDLNSSRATIKELMSKVISEEAPVSRRIMIRRVSEALNIPSNSKQLNEIIGICKSQLEIKTTTEDEMEFLWSKDISPDKYSDFRITLNKEREITDIPREEVANAVVQVIGDQVSLSQQDLIKEGAKALGFMRLGSIITSVLEKGISYASSNNLIHRNAKGNWIL